MNKPRKYNGVYKLPIKKHTKVRRPMSRWQLEYMLFENNPVLISNTLKMSVPPIKVNDISIGLENPLKLTPEPALGYKYFEYYKKIDLPKQSLLTRVKERLKR